jgi:hypothetical protein
LAKPNDRDADYQFVGIAAHGDKAVISAAALTQRLERRERSGSLSFSDHG